MDFFVLTPEGLVNPQESSETNLSSKSSLGEERALLGHHLVNATPAVKQGGDGSLSRDGETDQSYSKDDSSGLSLRSPARRQTSFLLVKL